MSRSAAAANCFVEQVVRWKSPRRRLAFGCGIFANQGQECLKLSRPVSHGSVLSPGARSVVVEVLALLSLTNAVPVRID